MRIIIIYSLLLLIAFIILMLQYYNNERLDKIFKSKKYVTGQDILCVLKSDKRKDFYNQIIMIDLFAIIIFLFKYEEYRLIMALLMFIISILYTLITRILDKRKLP